MSLQEMKELVATVFFSSALLTLAILFIMYKFAEITYKRAHKNVSRTCRKSNNDVNIVYDHGNNTKDWTIFDFKTDTENMNKILKEVM